MKNQRLVVLGGGESGVGAAILGKVKGYDVFLSDGGKMKPKYIDKLVSNNIAFEQGHHTEDLILNADLVVKSPGISEKAEMIIKLRGRHIPIISEIEFAGRYTDATMLCITGSNGKTTTTLLLHHLLTNAGINAGLAGNVGFSLAEQVSNDEIKHSCYVIELSSFQLDGMYDFKADVAILTNITPDHLDRYDYKLSNYINAKFRILNNMDDSGLFVVNGENENTMHKLQGMEILPYTCVIGDNSQNGRSGWVSNGILHVELGEHQYNISTDKLTLHGRHNEYNVMCAVLGALRMGLTDEQITSGLLSFPGVEHRLEFVTEKNGVRYINDSKATNVDSAWYALECMPKNVIWIVGGTDKGNDYSVLIPFVKEKVKLLICMGVDNRKIIDSFSGVCRIEDCHSLSDTMDVIKQNAVSGDTVLLSPCCASFDLFSSYEDRGKKFKEAVNKIQ